jgi:hypothetical protein
LGIEPGHGLGEEPDVALEVDDPLLRQVLPVVERLDRTLLDTGAALDVDTGNALT